MPRRVFSSSRMRQVYSPERPSRGRAYEIALGSASGIAVRPGWRRWQIEAFCLQPVLHFLNGAIKLLIFAFEFSSGIIIDDDIRINSVTFDDPLFAVFGVKRELRFEELSAVDKRQRFANSSYAAPSPFADELPKSKRLESERENIAIGGGEFVNQCYHRTGERLRRVGLRHAVTRDADHHQRAPQSLDHKRRDKAAAVAANINNERVFPDLRKVKLRELVEAGLAHVGNVQVTNLAAGFLRHVIDVLLHPIDVIKWCFVVSGHNGHVSRAVVGRFGIHAQDYLFAGSAD